MIALLLLLMAAALKPAAARPMPVQFTATVSPATARRGDTVTLTIKATIQSGYHMYSVVPVPAPGPATTTISVTGKGVTAVGAPGESKPVSENDPNFEKVVRFHVDQATLTQKLKLGPTAPTSGTLPLAVSVTYQACTSQFCLPPTTVAITVAPLKIGTAPKKSAVALPQTLNPPGMVTMVSYDPPSAPLALGGGLGTVAWAGFLAGLLALITPCVFPLIPVTFAFFTKQAQNGNASLVKLASLYALGIVICFTAIGSVFAAVFGAAGPSHFATNPVVNLIFAGLFILFGLSLLEAVEIRLPASLQRLAGARNSTATTWGVLGMGLTFVVAAFTCTAPFVGTILVAASNATTGGQWAAPIVGMLSFSIALALPFFLLALFPRLLLRLPRSGAWLSTVKGCMGFIELAAALKFLSNADLVWHLHILTAPVLLGLWAAIGFAGAGYLLGLYHIGYGGPQGHATPGRLVGASIFITASVMCVWGLFGRALPESVVAFLPPSDYGTAGKTSPDGELTYVDNLDTGLAQARAQNKPIFIDFTGYTCTNCRWMEKNIFVTAPVKDEMSQFVRIRLYTDGGANMQKNQDYEENTFGTVALPLYAVLSPSGKVIASSIGITREPSQFAAFLKKGAPAQVSER